MERGLENRRAGGASGESRQTARRQGGDLTPRLSDDAGVQRKRAELLASRKLHAGTDVEALVTQAFFPTAEPVIPIVIIFLGRVIHVVVGDFQETTTDAAIDAAPGVAHAIGWL
ncbi:MAG: hypothetical protein RLZZ214_1762 [Verrucomicrobiota bacterium]